jgi:hypothetical protein
LLELYEITHKSSSSWSSSMTGSSESFDSLTTSSSSSLSTSFLIRCGRVVVLVSFSSHKLFSSFPSLFSLVETFSDILSDDMLPLQAAHAYNQYIHRSKTTITSILHQQSIKTYSDTYSGRISIRIYNFIRWTGRAKYLTTWATMMFPV